MTHGKRWWRAAACVCAAVVVASCVPPVPDEPEEAAEEPAEEPRPDFVQEAVWSADGRRLVATWNRGGGFQLFGLFGPTDSVAPEPASGRPISGGRGAWGTWAPDGLWVAFGTGGNIVRVRPDGTGAEGLTAEAATDAEPDYSPDGRSIVFTRAEGEDAAPRLWVMSAEGGDARSISSTAPGESHHGPDWEPSGGRIAFYASEGGTDIVYVTTPQGDGFGRVGEGTFPAWSPDGTRLYFTQNDSIFWRPPEGGARRFVVADGFAPQPSPNGRWLAFVRGAWPSSSLYLLDLETGAEARITP